MIRVLVMIAAAGFVLSAATLTAAFALAGPEAISRGGWAWLSGDAWDDDWDDGEWDPSPRGPEITRNFPWSGGGSLDIRVPADVRYTQQAGEPVVTITGPKRVLDHLELEHDGTLRLRGDRRRWRNHKITVVVSAPAVSRFDLSGASTLTVRDYDQPRLAIELSGAAEARVSGRTDEAEVDLSGSAELDATELKVRGAALDISGAGEAVIGPTDWARVDISGSGEVDLLTDPPRLETDISGSGSINRRSPAAAADETPRAATST